MIKEKTVFVIGAGASAEVGLPTGHELKAEISNILSRSGQASSTDPGQIFIEKFFDLLANPQPTGFGWSQERIQKASNIVIKALPQAISIDNLIEAHKNNWDVKLVSKAAIMSCIASRERKCHLYFLNSERINHNGALSNIENTWFGSFFKILSESIDTDNLSTIFDNCSFVVFNYDRCIEHFLTFSLANYYDIGVPDAKKLVKRATIIHPYGVLKSMSEGDRYLSSLGNLDTNNNEIMRGTDESIKTFSEQITDQKILNSISDELNSCQRILFLGFGFHDQNMKLMQLAAKHNVRKVMGTAYRVSHANHGVIENNLKRWVREGDNNVDITIDFTTTCRDFMDKYSMFIKS